MDTISKNIYRDLIKVDQPEYIDGFFMDILFLVDSILAIARRKGRKKAHYA